MSLRWSFEFVLYGILQICRAYRRFLAKIRVHSTFAEATARQAVVAISRFCVLASLR
jgi:hypothetical protein